MGKKGNGGVEGNEGVDIRAIKREAFATFIKMMNEHKDAYEEKIAENEAKLLEATHQLNALDHILTGQYEAKWALEQMIMEVENKHSLRS